MSDDQQDQPARPVLRVVRGEPDAAELAALLAVVTARSGEPAQPEGRARSAWGDPAKAVRRPVTSGPDGWRASARPV